MFELLSSHCVEIQWLRYGDDIQKAKREPKLIKPHVEFFNDLTALCGGKLSLRRTMVHAAFKRVSLHRKDWFESESDRADWAWTMSGRLGAMCRHITQASIAKVRPTWLNDFVVNRSSSAMASKVSDEDDLEKQCRNCCAGRGLWTAQAGHL